MSIFPRIIVISAVSILISGCGMPVQIASLVADGISLLTTEKTVTDHGISIAAKKDCAVWRGISEGELCREYEDSIAVAAIARVSDEIIDNDAREISVTAAAPEGEGDEERGEESIMLAFAPVAPAPVEMVVLTPMVLTPVVLTPPAAMQRFGGLHYVVGSFAKRSNAERLTYENPGLSPRVVTATVGGRAMYRVVVALKASDERSNMRRILASAGFADFWAIRTEGETPDQGPRLLAESPWN